MSVIYKVWWLVGVPPSFYPDTDTYVDFAQAILAGSVEGDNIGFRPPFYPCTLALLGALFGGGRLELTFDKPPLLAGWSDVSFYLPVIQHALGVVLVFLVYDIVRRWTSSKWVASITGACVAVDPLPNSLAHAVLTDFPGTVLAYGMLWLCLRATARNTRVTRLATAAGLLGAMAGLNRAAHQLIFLMGVMLLSGCSLAQPVYRRVIAFITPVFLLYGTWFTVNYAKQDYFGMAPAVGGNLLAVITLHPEGHAYVSPEGRFPELREQIRSEWPKLHRPKDRLAATWGLAQSEYGRVWANTAYAVIVRQLILEHPHVFFSGFLKNLSNEFYGHWIQEYSHYFKPSFKTLWDVGAWGQLLSKVVLVSAPDRLFYASLPIFLSSLVLIPVLKLNGYFQRIGWDVLLVTSGWLAYIYVVPSAFGISDQGGRYKLAAVPLQYAMAIMLLKEAVSIVSARLKSRASGSGKSIPAVGDRKDAL